MRAHPAILCGIGALLAVQVSVRAQSSDVLATGQLEIQGTRLTIYTDGQHTDAEQYVNVGEPALVRTCFGGLDAPCGQVAPGDPRIAGLKVMGEVHGPELPQTITLETLPGGTFVLPGFQQEGDYRLENIRLVNTATGQVLGACEPAFAVLHVMHILLTQATVTSLSLADLQARGIRLTQENFQAFNFAVGFAFGESQVTIEFPVLYTGNGTLEALAKPDYKGLDGLPPDVLRAIRRWQPPSITPFKLEVSQKDLLEEQDQENQNFAPPVFGAIVLPGTISFLNQFFAARLIVANGAPGGSEVTLQNVAGALHVPPNNVLRIAQTDPPVTAGQQVPVRTAQDDRVIAPGNQGTASWTIEGLKRGTHTLQIDITADLQRPGRTTLPVASRTQAVVEVVDARFNLTFSHPDVVREGEAYGLFVTVTNLSQAVQNAITVTFPSDGLTGAHFVDPNRASQQIESLVPGQSETVEFDLVPTLTGKAYATTFQSDDPGLEGTVLLRAGVGEMGITLSPATLVMPRFSERLEPPFVEDYGFFKANVRLLGLAYSLAVAPAAAAPAGLPHIITSDVEQQAVDLAEAGQRTFLREQLLESLEVLLLDQLGNRKPLAEFDALRRNTTWNVTVPKGQAASRELATLLRHEQGSAARNLDAVAFLDHFAETTSYARPYVAAMVVPTSGSAAPELEFRLETQQGTKYLAYPSDRDQVLRGIPFGEIFAVREAASSLATVPFAVIGHVEPDSLYGLYLHNQTDQPNAGRVIVIVPDGGTGNYRRVEFPAVVMDPHTVLRVTIGPSVSDPGQGGFQLQYVASGLPYSGAAPTVSLVPLPPFRLIGAVQDYGLSDNRYGNGLSYLFNRPPDKASGESAVNFSIESTFNGEDVQGVPVTGRMSTNVGVAAFLQPSERVVDVRYSGPICPLGVVTNRHLLATASIVDTRNNPLDPAVPGPTVETTPLHVGGLVDGRVLRGTGDPVPGATVQLIRTRWASGGLEGGFVSDLVAETQTDSAGTFYFDFVEEPHFDTTVRSGFTLRAIVPPGADPATQPGATEEVSSVIRQQNKLAHVNIALLGRGSVTGKLVYRGGASVPNGQVTIASSLFQEGKTATVAADGSFRFDGMPVGPLTLTGRDGDGRRVYATVGLEQPGATVDVLLEIPPDTPPPGQGTVVVHVLRLGSTDPGAGAHVAVYSSGAVVADRQADSSGTCRIGNVPAGQVVIQAADWSVSRTPVVGTLVLEADQTTEITLTLAPSTPKVVSGRVLFHDPMSGSLLPVKDAVAFINGPGMFAYTDDSGRYRIDGVPTQGASDSSYQVTAIDYGRKLQGSATLPPILESSPEITQAVDIVLREMRGGVDGVVVDPLGRPRAGIGVALFPYGETTTDATGNFSFNDIPVGTITEDKGTRLIAHVGDGLQPGRVGYLGAAATEIVYGGHRPFVTIRLRGSGILRVHTRTSTSTGVLTPIYYKPTWYSAQTFRIGLKPEFIEATTDQNGYLDLEVPVGDFDLIAYNPFHGPKEVRGSIQYPGQIKDLEVLFDDASTVQGTVVDVDGITPVPGAAVTMALEKLLPQTVEADAQGRFSFSLVPQGGFVLTAAGRTGTVDRVGETISAIGGPGQTLDLVVQLKAQGSISGRIVETTASGTAALAHAQFYVQEGSYPFRRLPSDGSWFIADADGNYQLAHLFAGPITVVGRDPDQVARKGAATGSITADWQVAPMPDVVIEVDVGSIGVTVRDSQTGGVVPDCRVVLDPEQASQGSRPPEATVSDADGKALFDALPLGSHDVYVFHAPTGRSGRVGNLTLATAGQRLDTIVYLEQRGEVKGTLWDDESKTIAVPAGTVSLSGSTTGGSVCALATTSSAPETLGRFDFLGIPEGHFQLEAAAPTSLRRARAEADVSATSPIVDLNLVLEPVGDLYFKLFESLRSGLHEVDLSQGVFSIRVTQESVYDFTETAPTESGGVFKFSSLLLARAVAVAASEFSGEQRSARAGANSVSEGLPFAGSGTAANPYRLVLNPKCTARVEVKDAGGQPAANAQVTLTSTGGGSFASATDATGAVVFAAVPVGTLYASARSSAIAGLGGTAQAEPQYDDDIVTMGITLASVVSAHGIVYHAVPNDQYTGDRAVLVPEPGAIVQLHDSAGTLHVMVAGQDGTYRFEALPTGSFSLEASDATHQAFARLSGSLVGPQGNDNALPFVILDAAPPRIVSIVPPPGMDQVSRTAIVEIGFSEPLDPTVLPSGQSSPYFSLRSAAGALPPGTWSSQIESDGQQLVRFTPSQPYENSSYYSLTIKGGSNGVRDRVGRSLTDSGDVGSNFRTSDTVGPTVLTTDPLLERPVDPVKPIRFDFNEAVVATPEALDGDGTDDAAELYWEQAGSGGANEWKPYPVSMTLVRSDFSLSVQAVQGVELAGDTRHRRIVVSKLADSFGNEMQAYQRDFRIYDQNAPQVTAVPYPAGAPDGRLFVGNQYALQPVLANLDDVTPATPGGDIDHLDYFLADPATGVAPVASARTYPFQYAFVAAYGGNGQQPWPFTVWVRAVDTSNNQSNVVSVPMQVLPNAPPVIGSVTASALAPVVGVFYAGSTIRATVGGLADTDGAQVTVSLELWQVGGTAPVMSLPGRLVQRPASGSWADLPEPIFDSAIPIAQPEGSELFCRATAFDPAGSTISVDSAHFNVAHDPNPPVVEGLVVRSSPGGTAGTLFHIGDAVYLEFRARDAETAVETVSLSFDRNDIFPSPQAATIVAGTGNLYRTATLTVPHDVFSGETIVTATVTAADYGANTGSQSLTFRVAPATDPTAPTVEWLSPWEGANWPAAYQSVVSTTGDTALLLRVRAADTTLDADGHVVPGTIVDVQLRGPVLGSGGAVELAQTWASASLVAGSGQPGSGVYELLWSVPKQIPVGTTIPLEARVVDSGNLSTTESIRVMAVTPRKVYEAAVAAVVPNDPMLMSGGDVNGPIFLLDGATVSLYPQDAGAIRSVKSLFAYAGGQLAAGGTLAVHQSVLTAPEVTSLDSAILYYPLELGIEEFLGIGAGSRVDMSGRGLVAGTSQQSVSLPGETAAQPLAGGSHGGAGWFGSPSGGWDRDGLTQPGSVFDSVRDPRLPGGGGATDSCASGGSGGGVVRLVAAGATLHIAGDVVADGGNGSTAPYCGSASGGAGGSINIVAGRVEGRGSISANGGNGYAAGSTGGGGGGRIAIAYREVGGSCDLAAQSSARGGHDSGSDLTGRTRWAGAGTVYLEQLDPATGAAGGLGALLVRNDDGLPAGITPLPALSDATVVDVEPQDKTLTLDVPEVFGTLVRNSLVVDLGDGSEPALFPITAQVRVADASAPAGFRIRLTVDATDDELLGVRAAVLSGGTVSCHGRARFATVGVSGAARLACDDDLEVGPADTTPPLNDRSSVQIAGDGRLLLRGERPQAIVTTTPVAASDIRIGSSVAVTWTASDPLGLARVVETWSPAASPTVRRTTDQPIQTGNGGASFAIPTSASPGPVTYELKATDLRGRVATTALSWNVLANQPPTGTIAFAAGALTTVRGGFATTVTVHAEDAEGLARIDLQASGPATQPSQSRAVTGTSTDATFEVRIAPTADGQEPVVVTAVVTDTTGAAFSTPALEIAVIRNTPPSGTLSLVPAGGVLPNHLLSVTVSAQDDTGLTQAVITVSGAFSDAKTLTFPAGVTGQMTATFRVPATTAPGSIAIDCQVQDDVGLQSSLAQASVAVLPDDTAPVVTKVSPAEEASVTSGSTLDFSFTLTDAVGISQTTLTVGGQSVAVTVQNVQLPGDVWQAQAVAPAWRAPEVTSPQQISYAFTATDVSGHQTQVSGSFTVNPLIDANAPRVAILCPANGDGAAPGVSLTVSFTIEAVTTANPNNLLQLYNVLVDGQTVFSQSPIDKQQLQATYGWTPPAGAAPGTSFALRIEARDYAGNVGFSEVTLTIAEGLVLSGNQTLSVSYDQPLVLAQGTFTAGTSLSAPSLTLLQGATLTAPALQSLTLNVAGDLRIACGAAIEMTSRGYAVGVTYPGAVIEGSVSAGSHLGYGGVVNSPAGSVFGSVYRPQEDGAGGRDYSATRGGGVVRVVVGGDAVVDGVIRADGGDSTDGGGGGRGAGGSVWLSVVGAVSGGGSIEARGGEGSSAHAGGGGGAVAVEYGAGAGTVLSSIVVRGGNAGAKGGSGTIWLKSGSESFGDLIVDNAGEVGQSTELPGLGSGAAQAGSGGTTLVTDRSTAIPAYFVGHWVEVTTSTGTLKGTYRIGAIGGDGKTVELVTEPVGGSISVDPGDLWQGVYRFDNVTVRGGAKLASVDPIRGASAALGSAGGQEATLWSPVQVTGAVEVVGPIAARSITAGSLTVASGGRLTHPPAASASAPESVVVVLTGSLTVQAGGSIDVTSRGYAVGVTYPGAVIEGSVSAGSHLGYGGVVNSPAGSVFGSVYRPQEDGAGGRDYSATRGGGVVRVVVGGDAVVDGVIRADGGDSTDGGGGGRGAGGSVWLSVVGAVSGGGSIEARGGEGSSAHAGGGGGAVAVEYGAGAGTVLSSIVVRGGNAGAKGGSGTIWLKSGSESFGDLIVDNAGEVGQSTELPGLGSGAAQAGSGGTTLVTDRSTAIPAYFVGHWVEVTTSTGTLKGTYRIGAIGGDGKTVELVTEPVGGSISVDPGDLWQGVYRFDSLRVTGKAKVNFNDRVDAGTVTIDPGSSVSWYNAEAPRVEPADVVFSAAGGTFRVAGQAGAVSDTDGIASAKLRNLATAATWPIVVGADGSFAAVAVTGTGGDSIELEATDASSRPRTAKLVVGSLPLNAGPPTIAAGVISVAAHDSAFWVAGGAGAVSDPNGIMSAAIANPATGQVWPVVIAVDGSFPATVATGVSGQRLTVTASDAHPQPLSASQEIQPLPANAGPPIVDRTRISFTGTSGQTIHLVGGPGAASDPESPITLIASNQRTQAQVTGRVAADGSFALVVNGAHGDAFTLVATDGHPSPLSTTVTDIGPMPGNAAPVVDVTGIVIRYAEPTSIPYQPASYEISIAAGTVTDDGSDAIALTLADATTTSSWSWSINSGAALTARLVGGNARSGDEVELRVTDADPFNPQTTTVSLGTMPPDNYGPPTVDASGITLLPMGYGFQVTSLAGAVTDPDGPVTVVLKNETTSWTSPAVKVEADGSFYARIEGQTGDTITLVATDGHPLLELTSDPTTVGLLPAAIVQATELDLGGHTVANLRDRFAILDSGAAVGWLRNFPPAETDIFGQLVGVRNAFFNLKLQAPMALAGDDLVGWVEHGTPPVRALQTLQVSTGTLVQAQVRGDETFLVAEEAGGLALYRFNSVIDQSGNWTPDCGGTIGPPLILPNTVGLHALELLPAGGGNIAVLSDDPLGELRLVDITNPLSSIPGATVDLPGSAKPSWGAWQTGELFVGREDGSVEVWRWSEAGPQLHTSWRPAQGLVKAVARMGDQLWVGLDTGALQQVDTADPAQPHVRGELNLAAAIVAISREQGSLLVATAAHLYRVDIPYMPPTVAPDLVAWGHGGTQSWVAVDFTDDDVDIVSASWPDGRREVGWPQQFIAVSSEAAIPDPPTIIGISTDGIPSPPYTPTSVILRGFDRKTGPDLWMGVSPHAGDCTQTRAAAQNDLGFGLWRATGVRGQAGMTFSYNDRATGEQHNIPLATGGLLVGLLQSENFLIAVSYDNLTVFDPRDDNLGNPAVYQQVALASGSDAIFESAPDRGALVLGNSAPTRYSLVFLQSLADFSGTVQVLADNVLLPEVTGQLLDLVVVGEDLFALANEGATDGLYRYSISDPAQPVFVAKIELNGGGRAVSMGWWRTDNAFCCADSLLVTRRGGTLEVYDYGLSYRGSTQLPSEIQGIYRDEKLGRGATYVLLGNFGVARLSGPADQPRFDFIESNGTPPGNANFASSPSGVVTPDGVTWLTAQRPPC
jgi:hypothetical protein